MAGFLFKGNPPRELLGTTNVHEKNGCRKMIRERRNRPKKGFLALLERCAQGGDDVAEMSDLERLLSASYENPELFQEEWLRPLLAEGLNLDQAFQVVVEGTLRPN